MQLSIFDYTYDYKKITKPIRLIELFAGYGSQHFALEYLGVPFESYKISEWAVKSIQAYKDAHFKDDNTDYSKDYTVDELIDYLYKKGVSADYNEPMTLDQIKRMGEFNIRRTYNNIQATHNLVSVCNVHAQDLEITDTDKYEYIMTYSFPCFTKDSLVLTNNGYKQIIDIKVGDYVLSHDNKYHKVINTFNNGVHDIYSIKGMGIDGIKTTKNHKFYVREMYRKGHNQKRCFTKPKWKEVKDLTKKDYLGIAINRNNIKYVDEKLPTYDNNFWWIVGRYLGDGWLRNQGGIIICCGKDELQEITYHLDKLPFNYNVVEEPTVYKIHISKKCVGEFMSQFGTGASNKHLTSIIFDLPISNLKHLIDGYMSADGCFTNGVYKATSTSRELLYGIAQCIAKVEKTPYRIYKVKTKPKKIIDGREINQKDWYQLVYKPLKCKQDKAFYEDGYIWYPISDIKYVGNENVYDIEVEDSHSFTVQNTIVHNCQDLSKAGKGKGMEKGSGTRSGLLWEVERILKECKNLPQVLLMENVPEVKGTKNIDSFNAWLGCLESLGYHNYYEVLNAKDYGIPQNRERCFMISLLGDVYYEFPKRQKLTLKLKDLLEDSVDEKFYLSKQKITSISNWKAQQDPLKDIDKEKEISPCLTARGAREEHSGMVLINDDVYKNYNKIACEIRTDEGVRLFNDNLMGTLRTIDACGCKHIIEKSRVDEKYFLSDKTKTYFINQSISDNVSGTITTRVDASNGTAIYNNLRIRKLTPKECFRLMGVKDKDYENIAQHQSNSSLYHLAGDSIVVNVLMEIFRMFFEEL